MMDEVIIAGYGGQGIMLMGKLLAYGAIYQGLEVTFYPSYGPEMRGGTANCTLVIANERIGSPVRNRFSMLMAMNQASVDKFSEQVKPGGVIATNETLVDTPPQRADVVHIPIPANRIAMEMDNLQVANMVATGAMARILGRLSLNSLQKGLARVLPAYRHDLIPLNQEAMRRGYDAISALEVDNG